MSTRIRIAARAALLLTLLGGAAQAAALEPFTADYQASYMGMQATGSMTLASAGANRWKYSLDISNPLANLSQSTVFEEHQGPAASAQQQRSRRRPGQEEVGRRALRLEHRPG